MKGYDEMGTIKLDGQSGCQATMVSNRFLDDYMPNANGEFVKIYLYLLRALSNPKADISVCRIADVFNHTEKDVIRALKYWEQIGLLDLRFNDSNSLTNIKFKPLSQDYLAEDDSSIEITSTTADKADFVAANPMATTADEPEDVFRPAVNPIVDTVVNTPESIQDTPVCNEPSENKIVKKVYTASEVSALRSKGDVQDIIYVAESLIGKPLSRSGMNSVLFFYDGLGFSTSLIEYLIEYCVSNNHKDIRYMETVAIAWAEEGIKTVEQAKLSSDKYNQTCYPVLKAFGISGRNPGNNEKEFIVKWTNSYGFTMDVIVEACNRTLIHTGKQSFNYADGILTKWHEKGVKNLTDVKNLDEIHKASGSKKSDTSPKKEYLNNKNSFNNFDQRNIDYKALERELLKND